MYISQSNLAASSLLLIGRIVLFAFGIHTIRADNDQIKRDLIYMRNFNTSSIVGEILSDDWTENLECSKELNAFKSGLDNHEPWTIKGKLIVLRRTFLFFFQKNLFN